MAILTDRTELTSPATGDILHVVDVSDTTDNAAGTSKKMTLTNLVNGQTDESTIDTANDKVLFYDASATALRKTSISNISGSSGPAAPTSPASPFQSSGFAQATTGNPAGASDGSTVYTCGDVYLGWTDNSGGTATFDIWENGASIGTVAAGTTTFTVTSPTVGSHTYVVYAKDGPQSSSGLTIGPVTVAECILSATYMLSVSGTNIRKKIISTLATSSSTNGNTTSYIDNDGANLYITDSGDADVKKLDTDMNIVGTQTDFPSSGSAVKDVKITGGFAYVSDGGTNKIYKIDTSDMSLTATLAQANSPREMCTDGSFLYVRLVSAAGFIAKIDLSTFTLDSTIDATASGTTFLDLATDGTNLYIPFLANDKVTRINLSTLVATDLSVGDNPQGVHIVGTNLYVSNINDNNVEKVDLGTFTSQGTVSVGTSPKQMTNVGDTLYVLCGGSSNSYSIDLTTFSTSSLWDSGTSLVDITAF